jgi:predicted HTH domain antitoxin
MVIELPDSVLAKTPLSEQRIKLLLAITLFREELLTLGQAAALADLPQLIFQQELAKRKIPMHYGIEELKQDIRHLKFV